MKAKYLTTPRTPFTKHLVIVYGLLLVFLAGSCDLLEPEIPEFKSRINDPIVRYESQLDLSYGAHTRNKFDIHYPVSVYRNPSDVVILIHGGSWTGGEKWFLQPSVDSLKAARKNLAIVNINYRVTASAPKSLFDNQIEDIGNLIKYLKTNASRFNIRNDRFAIMGASAGGHLALSYAYLDEQEHIHTVIAMSAITELTAKELSGTGLWTSIQTLTGQNYSEKDNAKLIAASPVHLANFHSPRTMMLYGALDDLVYLRQQTLLREKLLALRIPNSLYIFKDQTHNVDAVLVAKSILAALGADEYDTYLKDYTLQ